MFKPVAIVSMVMLVACIGYSSFSTTARISKLQTTLSEKKAEYQKDLDAFNKLNNERSKSSDIKNVLINAKSAGEKVAGIQNKLNTSDDESLIISLGNLMDSPKKFLVLPVANAEWKFITNYSVNNGNKLPVCFLYKSTNDDTLYAYALATYDGMMFRDLYVKVTKAYTDAVYSNANKVTDGDTQKTIDEIKRQVDAANSESETSESASESTSVSETTEDDQVDIGDPLDVYMSESEMSSLSSEQSGGSN